MQFNQQPSMDLAEQQRLQQQQMQQWIEYQQQQAKYFEQYAQWYQTTQATPQPTTTSSKMDTTATPTAPFDTTNIPDPNPPAHPEDGLPARRGKQQSEIMRKLFTAIKVLVLTWMLTSGTSFERKIAVIGGFKGLAVIVLALFVLHHMCSGFRIEVRRPAVDPEKKKEKPGKLGIAWLLLSCFFTSINPNWRIERLL
eukprot:TRINITY_DN69315_c0_g1_i1.p1 TRINITY_DN69315_c0_g1~~TRINITY_DN69315_c0_g1_i1.p1  ORF type:complete len:197 (-),score=27.32 TRINITY_DN69315_c0_g1_i1:111-701(-)